MHYGNFFECMRLHRKKGFSIFSSPAGMPLTKLSLGGNNDGIYKLFPPRESLVSPIYRKKHDKAELTAHLWEEPMMYDRSEEGTGANLAAASSAVLHFIPCRKTPPLSLPI
jgi:hypothetical protein